MDCSIVIVTFNSCLTIGDCLSPLVNMPNAEIIVLDNDSEDDTVSLIREQFPSIQLIALPENIGFGRACNIGVAASAGSFIFLLNPDAVAAPQAITTLCDFLERHPQVGIVGGRFLDPLGRPLQAVGGHPSLCGLVIDKPLGLLAKHIQPQGFLRTILGKLSLKFRLSKTSEKVAWVSGAALCCRRSTWDAIGGFDENFFLYYEDVDFCLRTSQAGWEVWHTPDAIVSHQSGASFAGNLDFQKRVYFMNQRYFFQKHCGPLTVFFLSILQKGYSHLKLYRHFANDRIGPSI